ncbi:hypothetical protein [Asticcacaulis sp. 201]|uniref:hypothetical protein n=1 Tax=Asticcacaulis sp. 201 TaxID=3028787 RepID=UPI002915DFFC|nr:hypothetical protein [Asticcacaulis sp. 201]MDV6331307.1 hypothetical protein [Asticcacaulis sp. 201]
MMAARSSRFSLTRLPIAAYFVVAAVIAMFALSLFLSQPGRAKARLAELERQAALIEAASQARGDLVAFPVGTVCTGMTGDALKGQLGKSLMASGLVIEAFDLEAASRIGNAPALQAYTVSLKAKGSYEQALTAMARLAQYRPQLFLDALSLRNQTDSVDLNVEGRLFCRSKA